MKHQILALAVAAFCFTACTNEDNISQDFLADTPIKLNVSVDEPTTRAGYSNDVLPEKFWLFVIQDLDNWDNIDSKYNYRVNVKKEGNSWKTYKDISGNVGDEITMLWANMNNTAYICAGSKEKDNEYISTTEDQSTEDKLKGADLLGMPTTTVIPSTDGISVNFKHAMSKINLTIELGSEYEFSKEEVEKKITDVKIDGSVEKAKYWYRGSEGFTFSGHVNQNSKTITPYYTDATPFSKDADGVITKASATYEAILIPQTIASGNFTVSFKVDGKLYEWTYNKDLTLDPSTAYTLKLIAGDDKVQPASFSVAAWNPGNGENGEEKETD